MVYHIRMMPLPPPKKDLTRAPTTRLGLPVNDRVRVRADSDFHSLYIFFMGGGLHGDG